MRYKNTNLFFFLYQINSNLFSPLVDCATAARRDLGAEPGAARAGMETYEL